MTIKIKRYEANVTRYEESPDGTIIKVTENVPIKAGRITQNVVEKQVPRGCIINSHGYITRSFEIADDILLKFLEENAKELD